MANQPQPTRPWLLRLASQARTEPTLPPPPQPQPARPPIRPVRAPLLAPTRTPPPQPGALLPRTATSAPTPPRLPPPQPQPTAATTAFSATSSLQTTTNGTATNITSMDAPKPPTPRPMPPPSPRPVATPPPLQHLLSPMAVTSTTGSPTPPQSPKVITTNPSPSPSPRLNSTKPSAALTPYPEPEPKPLSTVEPGNTATNKSSFSNGARETRNNSAGNSNHNPSPPSKRDEKNLASGNGWAAKKKDQKEMNAITIAGHNVGAFMDLGSSYGGGHQSRMLQLHRFKVESDPAENVKVNGEGTKAYAEGKAITKGSADKKKPWFSLVNSNVQSVNSSLLLNASCVQGSPGVHINVVAGRRQTKTSSSANQKNHPSPD